MEEALFPHVHGDVILHNQEVELTSMSMDDEHTRVGGEKTDRHRETEKQREPVCVVYETIR